MDDVGCAVMISVNLDDDLFVQEDADIGNNSSELVLDEFVECLVRIAVQLEDVELADEMSDERRDYLIGILDGFVDMHLNHKTFGKLGKKKR